MKISCCTWIYNRLWQLAQTLPINIERAKDFNVEFVLFDAGSTDGLSNWLESTKLLNRIQFVSRPHEIHFAKLLNESHRLASGDVLVNLDADNFLGENFFAFLATHAAPKTFFHIWSGTCGDGTCGRLVFNRQDFWELGGYDESLGGCGGQDVDLVNRAEAYGFNIVVETNPKIVGRAVRNTKQDTCRYVCDSRTYEAVNFDNLKISDRNIREGKLVANKEMV